MTQILLILFNQLQPPAGFPAWLIPVLGFILPWIYKVIIDKLKGWVKFILVAIITYGIAILCAVLAGIPFNGSLSLFVWIFTCSQFIYNLLVKPVKKNYKEAI